MKRTILHKGKRNELHIYDDGKNVIVRTKSEALEYERNRERIFYMVIFAVQTAAIIGFTLYLIKILR